MLEWPAEPEVLDAEQRRLAGLTPVPWALPACDGAVVRVGGVFLAYGTGKQGPGHAGAPPMGVPRPRRLAARTWPREQRGAWAPLRLDGEGVGAWLRTTATSRPL